MSGPSASRVRDVFDYDPKTGLLIWKVRTSNRVCFGRPAGNKNAYGYLATAIDGSRQMVHRLVWVHVHGVWPRAFLDHINGDRSDNRIENLREATPEQNAWNSRSHVDSLIGVKGINVHNGRRKPFQARIYRRGSMQSLGYYETLAEAKAAYEAADRVISGEFARVA